MIVDLETDSALQTYELGKKFGKNAKPGDIYCLNGDMGAGKTVFAQGFAEGLGIKEGVNSPTFPILQTYTSGRLQLYHFDVYRIEDEEEMDEIGYEDCFFGEGVCLIEWSEMIADLIPEYAVKIWIEHDPKQGYDHRRITYSCEDEMDIIDFPEGKKDETVSD